jgi:hypothetical protein
MELKLLKGLVPAIESLKYSSDEMRRIIMQGCCCVHQLLDVDSMKK